MPTLQRPWGTYHHLDVGEGAPIVLLHAFPLSSAAFAGQLGRLPGRLLVPDHRGFGGSDDVPPDAVPMEAYAEDVLALLDHLGVARAVVGGVSMGGYVAMALLAKAPERVSGLILMDTQAGADADATRDGRETLARAVLAQGLPALDPTVDKLVAPGSPHRAGVGDLVRAAARPSGVAAAVRGMALRPDRGEALAAFPGPTLVLVGALDGITGPDKAEAMVRRLAHPTLCVVPGVGHLANLEAPDAVNAAIRAWLDAACP